jgi:serine/threonine protein phosphatase PrpC
MFLNKMLWGRKVFARKPRGSRSLKLAVPIPLEPSQSPSLKVKKLQEGTCKTASGSCSLDGKKHEDRIIFEKSIFKNISMYAVIDGHGGAETADFLQETLPRVVRVLCQERRIELGSLEKNPSGYLNILQIAYKLCAQELDSASQTPATHRSGAVATTVLIENKTCLIAHVGDCRVIAGTGTAAASLTEEHRASTPSERFRIESRGGQVTSGRVKGLLSPRRVFGNGYGSGNLLNYTALEPDCSIFHVDLEGFLIISSDGVNDVVDVKDSANLVRTCLEQTDDANQAAKDLAQYASKSSNDDISVIVIAWSQKPE